jgi:3-hydroxyacyl-CoA dehydrogenase
MQALLMHDKKIASTKDIDVGMMLGAGHPMGPLQLADYVGLDTCLSILQGWKEVYPDEPAFIVPENLVRKVQAGDFGRKSGKGFYTWNGDKVGEPVE